jgi:hypothetical protein
VLGFGPNSYALGLRALMDHLLLAGGTARADVRPK